MHDYALLRAHAANATRQFSKRKGISGKRLMICPKTLKVTQIL